jgi:hypothetical protein
VKRNLPTYEKALKIELWQFSQNRRLAQSQPFPLKQRQCEFSPQLLPESVWLTQEAHLEA